MVREKFFEKLTEIAKIAKEIPDNDVSETLWGKIADRLEDLESLATVMDRASANAMNYGNETWADDCEDALEYLQDN